MIARLLHNLVKKDQKQDWIEKQEKVFIELKKRFIKELVLAVLNLNKKIRIKVNMSDYVMEGIMFMECKNKKYRPIVYLSKSLNETEKKYKIHNKNH